MRWGSYPHGLLVAFLVPLLFAGCTSWIQRGAKGVGLLPKATASEQQFSTYQPANPYLQLGEGLLSRERYEGAGPSGLHIEVRDLLVGPQKQTAAVTLPGAVICEVNSGNGSLTSDGQARELRPGATFSLREGSSFFIKNNLDNPISIRVYLLRTK